MNLSAPIPPEVWMAILKFVRNPVPLPLSKPDRSALRQPHLVSAIRVCKLFKEICVPLLYTTIVTDRFDKLLTAAAKPCNRHLYAHTKTLFIEYHHKGEDPTYLDIFEGLGRWRSVADSTHPYDVNFLAICHSEVVFLGPSLETLSLKKLRMSSVLPSLRSIAVSSIYGKDGEKGDAWQQYHAVTAGNCSSADDTDMEACIQLFHHFLASGDLQHLCIRDTFGPLSLPLLSKPDKHDDDDDHPPVNSNRRTTTTMHFIDDLSFLPITLRSPIRWASDLSPTSDWAHQLSQFGEGIKAQLSRRLRASVQSCGFICTPMDLEIFCSTDHYGRARLDDSVRAFGLDGPTAYPVNPPINPMRNLTPAVQQMMAEKFGASLQKLVRSQSRSKGNSDSVRWRASSDTPICLACGSGPPV